MKYSIADKRNFLLDTDWLDENFTMGFLSKESDLKSYLNSKRFRLSKAEVSSRVFNHWLEIALVDEDRLDDKGWRSFSYSEIIWLSIIDKLRSFGLELGKIKQVKTYFTLHSSERQVSRFPILDYYIGFVLSNKEPVSLVVFDSGEALLARQSAIDISKQYGLIKDDYISIDLNSLIKKRFNLDGQEVDYMDYSLHPIESEFKQAFAFEDVHSLTLRLSKGKGEYLLDKEFILSSKEELNTLFRKLKYAEAKEEKRGGKSIYKLTEKKKIMRMGRPQKSS